MYGYKLVQRAHRGGVVNATESEPGKSERPVYGKSRKVEKSKKVQLNKNQSQDCFASYNW